MRTERGLGGVDRAHGRDASGMTSSRRRHCCASSENSVSASQADRVGLRVSALTTGRNHLVQSFCWVKDGRCSLRNQQLIAKDALRHDLPGLLGSTAQKTKRGKAPHGILET
jgi:hypothetical protein